MGYLMRSYAVAMFFNNLLPSTIGGDGYRAFDTSKSGIPKAKALAREVKCPIIPGSEGVVEDLEEGLREAKRIGYPIFIKAVAGGGGKGIRIAHNREEFIKMFNRTFRKLKQYVKNHLPQLLIYLWKAY